MHRRPLGRGRTLAALAAPLMAIGCALPWWRVGGTPGLPATDALTGNGLAVLSRAVYDMAREPARR